MNPGRALRSMIANRIIDALRADHPEAEIERGRTTSNSEIVKLVIAPDEAINITIKKAEK